jgi:plastocyanin
MSHFTYTRGNTVLLIVIILAVIIGIGAIWYVTQRDQDTGVAGPAATSSEEAPSSDDEASVVGNNAEAETITVTYKNGFVPPIVVIENGDTISFKNRSRQKLVLEGAGPNVPGSFGENALTIPPGDSYQYTTSATGTWQYRNAQNSSESGTVRVKAN